MNFQLSLIPMMTKQLYSLGLLVLTSTSLWSQSLFPIKSNQQWGLINGKGDIVVSPHYDALGEMNENKELIVQKNAHFGIINNQGKEIVAPQYEDLYYLSDNIFVAKKSDEKILITNKNKILFKGFDRVDFASDNILFFTKNNKIGAIDKNGNILLPPHYDKLEIYKEFIYSYLEEKVGIATRKGRVLLPSEYKNIIPSEGGFIHRKKYLWGYSDKNGKPLFPEIYQGITPVNDEVFCLTKNDKITLYNHRSKSIILEEKNCTPLAFKENYIQLHYENEVKITDNQGGLILSQKYQEVNSFHHAVFRTRQGRYWGLSQEGDISILPHKFDYISPPSNDIAFVKIKNKYGIVNTKGKTLYAPQFDKIEWNDNGGLLAYKGSSVTILGFDTQGNLTTSDQIQTFNTLKFSFDNEENKLIVGKYEWYLDPTSFKWGLRNLLDGTEKIPPTFDKVIVEAKSGFSYVGILQSNKLDLAFTTFQFEYAFALVKNDTGFLISDFDYLDIRFSDFEEGLPAARVIFKSGRHGLIKKDGSILLQGYAYIGKFQEGLARVSIRGVLSSTTDTKLWHIGTIKDYLSNISNQNKLFDYTNHDMSIKENGLLYCKRCTWGYIDTIGRLMVPPKYQAALPFKNKVGKVKYNDKWGLVNYYAQEPWPCQFDDMEYLTEQSKNFVVAKNLNRYGLIDTAGVLITAPKYEEFGHCQHSLILAKRGNKWGFVDLNGKEIIPCQYRSARAFSEGVAAVQNGGKWGYIDTLGRVVIPHQYPQCGDFKEGLAWVSTPKGISFINQENITAITPQYDKAYDFEAGVARVRQKGAMFFINRFGHDLSDDRHDFIEPFLGQSVAIARTRTTKLNYYLVDNKGKRISTTYDKIFPFQEGLAIVRDDGKYGYIDTQGKLIIAVQYDKVSQFSEGKAWVRQNGQCGYIDKEGKQVIGFEFSKCTDYEDGHAVVYKNARKGGILDTEGEYTVAPSLDKILKFSNGRGLMRGNDYRYYFIRENGDQIKGDFEAALPFSHNIAIVQFQRKWGVINQNGMVIIPPKYDEIAPFDNGIAKVKVAVLKGVVNTSGHTLIPVHYEYLRQAGNNIFRVEEGGKIGYINAQGTWIWKLQE